MSDTDRRLDDIEKRLARLERAAEKPSVDVGVQGMVRDFYDAFEDFEKRRAQWCACGRDVCRAPDCPSHRNDPLGR